MSQDTTYYPPNPERLPKDLTELDWPYFLRALLVLVTLILFVLLYLGLLAGSGYVCYASIKALGEAPVVQKVSPADAVGSGSGRRWKLAGCLRLWPLPG